MPSTSRNAGRIRRRTPARRAPRRALAALLTAFLLLAPSADAGGIGLRVGRAAHDPAAVRGDPDEAPEPGPIRRAPGAPAWPEDFEVGLQAARAFAHYFGLVESDSLLQRVNRIGYEVASQTGRDDILFTFHILDVPDPNALALPGGFLFITQGMMDLGLTDDALAHLIGHEIAHVTESHFGRSDRLNAALSLLQTAVLVAAILAVPPSASGGYDRDEETGSYRYSMSGTEAAVQSTSVFGSVFKELLLRGYSRGLEMEADDVGRRYASRAGFPAGGGVELMEGLHERVFEDQEFGYWRTHPYFTDRVARARVAREVGAAPPDSAEVAAYRERIQKRVSDLAASILDEPTALFLYRAALDAGPRGASSIEVRRRLLRMRVDRLERQKPILRAYGPVVADYDSLIGRARTDQAPEALVARLVGEREELDRGRREIYDRSTEILDREQTGRQFLQLFVENFPEDPRTSRVRLRLAEQYRLSDRPDDAALVLHRLREDLAADVDGRPATTGSQTRPGDEPSTGRTDEASALGAGEASTVQAERELRRVLPLVRELTTTERIVLESSSDSIRALSASRLRAQAAELDSLELGSRFLQEFPGSSVAGEVRIKVEDLAKKRYYEARLKESLRDFQVALDGYHRLILLAPGTEAAALARSGVTRIQSLAGH